jgi:trehalose/maltose hydrolase-like predicted phosphorylase
MVLRELRFRDRAGRETSLRSRRVVSLHRMHQAAIAWELTPENWSGKVEVVSALDGRVVNQGVARYRELEGRHLDPQGPRIGGTDVIALKARTRQSRIELAEAARTRVYRGDEELDAVRSTYQSEDYIQQVLAFEVKNGATVRVEKIVALYSSRDRGISEPLEAAVRAPRGIPASTRRSPARWARGTSSGRSATRSFRAKSAFSSCCGSTPRISCRCVRG